MNKSEAKKIAETFHEVNKSLVMLRDICSNLASDNDNLRTRVADLEARVAYYTQDKPNLIVRN